MNFQDKKTKKEGGFTIIESMIAISIVLIGILSALILIIRSLALAPLIEDKLIASAVAQDCIERVIQVRNSNYIRSTLGDSIPWDESFNQVKDCHWESENLKRFFASSTNPGIDHIPLDIVDVSTKEKKIGCTVYWKTKGTEYNLTVTDNLFDWGKLYD
ncbi:MAG: type II secretion system protein [Candidatus Parcubacteria bacterium]|nr:type II secretion system protein [Candidatus Parcubacteria bacterium]